MSGLSRPSFLRICSTACLVAAGPAKYAAGSQGSARVKRNVTITTPIKLGIANINRLPIMVSMGRCSLRIGGASRRYCFCSLPPCGGGLGRGVSREGGACGYPSRCPLRASFARLDPTRGEGMRELGSPHQRAREQHAPVCPDHSAQRLRLHQRAVVEAAVEPVLIARDVLLHRDVYIGLIERNARNIGECQVDKTL